MRTPLPASGQWESYYANKKHLASFAASRLLEKAVILAGILS